MKFGAPAFSYKNFRHFARDRVKSGFYTINLGDNMQTLAVKALYGKLGISEGDVVSVDRDSMASYTGSPVCLIMNGCFYRWSFPIPENIIPVFIGFQAREDVISEFVDFFKRHEPIGCRDQVTADLFQKHGVAAFTTGCLTMTFGVRRSPPANGRVLIVYGSGAGAIPQGILKHIPGHLLDNAEFIFQRKVVHSYPLNETEMEHAELYARHLLRDYRHRASLVITPLHHAAAPCMASGIPVIICRERDDPRFSYLRTITRVYLPEDFPNIKWDVKPVNIAPIRKAMIEQTKVALDAAIRRSRALI